VTDVKVRKINKKRGFHGIVILNENVDNSFEQEMTMWKKQGGEYREMPFSIPKKDMCKFYGEDKTSYEDFANASDFPYPFECPLLKVKM
jgi:hypothetical protein